MASRPRRARAGAALAAGAYDEANTAILFAMGSARVQQDTTAASDDEEGGAWERQEPLPKRRLAAGPAKAEKVATRTQEQPTDAALPVPQAEGGTATSPAPLSTCDYERQLQRWVQDQRNANTARTYDSNMRQFVRWAEGAGSMDLLIPIDVERPSEANVAAYMRYMVMELGRPMTTVGVHLSAIANHVRFVTNDEYRNPTAGPLTKAMRGVLKDRAPRPGGQQKRALSWESLMQLADVWARAMDPAVLSLGSVRWMASRDQTMILLGFFFLLRRSEVVRMRRQDVSFARVSTGGTPVRIVEIYVNEKCKNDSERKGHSRVAAERPGQPRGRPGVCLPRGGRICPGVRGGPPWDEAGGPAVPSAGGRRDVVGHSERTLAALAESRRSARAGPVRLPLAESGSGDRRASQRSDGGVDQAARQLEE